MTYNVFGGTLSFTQSINQSDCYYCCNINITVDERTTGWPKKLVPCLYALTLPDIYRFSKLFHCQNQQKICNNTITRNPTTP